MFYQAIPVIGDKTVESVNLADNIYLLDGAQLLFKNFYAYEGSILVETPLNPETLTRSPLGRLSRILPDTERLTDYLTSYDPICPTNDPRASHKSSFAKAILKHFPNSILDKQLGPKTPRDLKIVASLSQWLGSNCGRCFLDCTLLNTAWQGGHTAHDVHPERIAPEEIQNLRTIEKGVAIDARNNWLIKHYNPYQSPKNQSKESKIPSAISFNKDTLSEQFAVTWINENAGGCTTPTLILQTGNPITLRDQLVGSTWAVWLGTDEGKAFLREALTPIVQEGKGKLFTHEALLRKLEKPATLSIA